MNDRRCAGRRLLQHLTGTAAGTWESFKRQPADHLGHAPQERHAQAEQQLRQQVAQRQREAVALRGQLAELQVAAVHTRVAHSLMHERLMHSLYQLRWVNGCQQTFAYLLCGTDGTKMCPACHIALLSHSLTPGISCCVLCAGSCGAASRPGGCTCAAGGHTGRTGSVAAAACSAPQVGSVVAKC